MIKERYDILYSTNIFGQTVRYTPQVGVPFDLDCLFDDEFYDVLNVATTAPQINAPLSLFGTPPRRGDTVEVNGFLYTTNNPENDGLGVVTIPLFKVGPV